MALVTRHSKWYGLATECVHQERQGSMHGGLGGDTPWGSGLLRYSRFGSCRQHCTGHSCLALTLTPEVAGGQTSKPGRVTEARQPQPQSSRLQNPGDGNGRFYDLVLLRPAPESPSSFLPQETSANIAAVPQLTDGAPHLCHPPMLRTDPGSRS